MKKTLVATVSFTSLAALLLASIAIGNGALDPGDPAIMISPQMIVLDKIGSVTVHSNIPAGSVDASSVALDGVAALGVWADDCGHLVARFAVADLGLVPGDATLTLTGDYNEPGESFAAADNVRVK